VSAADLQPLIERFGLSAAAGRQLNVLAHMLSEDPLAPTTVREPERVRDDHLADSLVALELNVVREARTMIDIGAGAGLPGLALAAALPTAQITLIDAVGRKCEFIGAAASAMGLTNAITRHARAEDLGDLRGQFDIVAARALAPLDVVAEYAAPLLESGGHLVAWRGKREPQVEAEAEKAAEILGLCVLEPVQVFPYPQAEHRYLHLMSKLRQTPARFPRRAGMARKRPLGAR
jgi:16S rRNA (guanine527-N7)-methyltransferase